MGLPRELKKLRALSDQRRFGLIDRLNTMIRLERLTSDSSKKHLIVGTNKTFLTDFLSFTLGTH